MKTNLRTTYNENATKYGTVSAVWLLGAGAQASLGNKAVAIAYVGVAAIFGALTYVNRNLANSTSPRKPHGPF